MEASSRTAPSCACFFSTAARNAPAGSGVASGSGMISSGVRPTKREDRRKRKRSLLLRRAHPSTARLLRALAELRQRRVSFLRRGSRAESVGAAGARRRSRASRRRLRSAVISTFEENPPALRRRRSAADGIERDCLPRISTARSPTAPRHCARRHGSPARKNFFDSARARGSSARLQEEHLERERGHVGAAERAVGLGEEREEAEERLRTA